MTEPDGYGGTRLTDAKNAAKAAVGMLGENDRIAIVTFSYGVSLYLPFTYTNTTKDRTYINLSIIDPITASGGTSLFDASSYATYYMDVHGRSDAVKGLIYLTDGVSNDDDYTSTSWYKYAPGGGTGWYAGYEPNEPGPVQYYADGNGLCGIPYRVFTVSIGTTPDARMHAIALTSPSNTSFGVVCSNPQKLADLFMMFVEKLQMESTGGIRAPEPLPEKNTPALASSTAPSITGVSLTNMPFVVFADGFRSKNWSAPMLGSWIPWARTSWWYISEWSLQWDGYRTCAYTPYSGQTLIARIDATPVLTKLVNTGTAYTVKYVNVSFLAYGYVAVDVSIDNSTWTEVGSGTYGGVYVQYPIPLGYINPANPFYLRFRSTGWLYLDDVIVLYVLDTSSGGGSTPAGYTISPAHYRFLTTPAVRVGTPYLSFWNYNYTSGSYETGNLPDHVVVIDYENHYYWLYDANGAVAYQGNFVVLQNNSYTGNASKTAA
ncbi:MAG: VWA domain-containing protein, partial [Candidatus Micrarchaeia archaeon]